MLSCIVPCYNEEAALPFFKIEILKVIEDLSLKYQLGVEVIFVDDGSKDSTLDLLKGFHQENEALKYLSFSKNFGKEAAIYAGLQHSSGDYVVLLDADMQDPPKLILEMFDILRSGEYDSVATRRVTRNGEPPIRSFFAKMFYKIINKISDVDIVDGARDFRMMTREMTDAILSMPEYNRFSKGIFGWVGFNTKWLPYENVERVAGETKWSFFSLFVYSLQGIIAFSTLPLYISSLIGLIFCVVSILVGIFLFMRTLFYGDPVAGWTSLICVVIFLGGLQLFSIGVMSQYLSKMYLETKQRPLYIIKQDSGKKNDKKKGNSL